MAAATAIRLCFRPNRLLFQNITSSLHFYSSSSSFQTHNAPKNDLQKVEPNKNAVSNEMKTESARIHSYGDLVDRQMKFGPVNDNEFSESDSESGSESELESDVEEQKREWYSFRRNHDHEGFLMCILDERDDDFAARFRRWSMHIEWSREEENEVRESIKKEEEKIVGLFMEMEERYKKDFDSLKLSKPNEEELEWMFQDELGELKKGIKNMRRDKRKMKWSREEKEKDRLQLLRKIEEATRVRLVFQMEEYEKMKLLLQMEKMERLDTIKALGQYGSELTEEDITKMRAAARTEQYEVMQTIEDWFGTEDMNMVKIDMLGITFENYREHVYSSDDYDLFRF